MYGLGVTGSVKSDDNQLIIMNQARSFSTIWMNEGGKEYCKANQMKRIHTDDDQIDIKYCISLNDLPKRFEFAIQVSDRITLSHVKIRAVIRLSMPIERICEPQTKYYEVIFPLQYSNVAHHQTDRHRETDRRPRAPLQKLRQQQ